MKTKTLSALFVIIGVALFAYVLGKFPLGDATALFLKASVHLVVIYFAISFLIIFAHTLRWSIILHSQGHSVPILKLFSYKLIGYGISFLTPAAKIGGEPVRAAILQRDGVDFTTGASSTLIDKFMELSASGIVFVFGLLFFIFSYALPPATKIVIFVICSLIALLIVLFYVQMFSGGSFLHKFFRIIGLYKIGFFKKHKKKIVEMERLMIKFFKKDKKHFVMAIIVTACAFLFMFVEYKSAVAILGEFITLPQVFLVFSVVGVAYLIPVPLALGTLEASQISLFSVLRMGTAVGLALSLLIKFRELVFTAIGMFFLSIYGVNFRKAYDETIEDLEKSYN
jgi:uncharacterized protein (TIRG00374 family)